MTDRLLAGALVFGVMHYFRELPEYAGRLLQRLDLVCGVVIGLLFFLVAYLFGASQNVVVTGTVLIIVFASLEAGYGVYYKERIMRAEREAKIRLSARPGSVSWNVPDAGPGKVGLKTHVYWEIWTDIDIKTAQVCLNIIGIRHRKWWHVLRPFQPKEKALIGLRPKGQDTPVYRKSFRAMDPQPIEDSAEFEYEGPFDWDGNCRLELVILTGSPAGEYRADVDPRLWDRGSMKPL